MENSEKLSFIRLKYQYLAVICVNLLSISQGYSVGWVSPSLEILRSDNTPLASGPITLLETTLLGVTYCLGSFLGIIVFSMLSNHIGRITTITLLGIPNVAFWIILFAADSMTVILIGKVIMGMAYGGMNLCVPLFVAEIADQRIRGVLGSILSIKVTIGVLLGYICVAYMDYAYISLVIIPLPIIFLFSMIFLPETPTSLLRQNKIEAAKKSIQFYNNGNSCDKDRFDADAELQKLQNVLQQGELSQKEGNFKLILNRESLKGLGSALALIAIVSFSAVHSFTTFASDFFTKADTEFDANLSLIIIGALNVLGTAVSAVLIDSWGRRKLFGLSATLSGAALIAFGIFSYLNNQGVDVTSFYWVPVTCVSLYIFVGAAAQTSNCKDSGHDAVCR